MDTSLDLVYHSGVLCQIPEDGYEKFFGKIQSLKPKYYMFVEGVNLNGYEKIPNSVLEHDHSKEKGIL